MTNYKGRNFVVVGASLAGALAVQTLREEGFDGRVVLIGDEPHPPYERPPLSKGYLRGETPRERIHRRVRHEPPGREAHEHLGQSVPGVRVGNGGVGRDVAYGCNVSLPGGRLRNTPRILSDGGGRGASAVPTAGQQGSTDRARADKCSYSQKLLSGDTSTTHGAFLRSLSRPLPT